MSEDPTKETNEQELTPEQLEEVAGGSISEIHLPAGDKLRIDGLDDIKAGTPKTIANPKFNDFTA